MKSPSTEWLGLKQVSEFLGVHPATVRKWSNQGVLPVQRTNGGHRRYKRQEVELWLESQRGGCTSEFDLMMQTALRNTRFQISEGHLNNETWYEKIDQEAKLQYRQSGKAMLAGMISVLGSNGEKSTTEARSLGFEYALRAMRAGLTVVEATKAFLFFRNVLLDSMLAMYEQAAINSAQAWSEMFRKINTFTDQILTTMLESYKVQNGAEIKK